MGGGTTIVEAIASGRRAIGVDLNSLAYLLATVKTTPLSEGDTAQIQKWARDLRVASQSNIKQWIQLDDTRLKNAPAEIKRVFSSAVLSLRQLGYPRQRRFARCLLLRWGQWALESRKTIPDTSEMATKPVELADSMLDGLQSFVEVASSNNIPKNKLTGRRELYHDTASSLAKKKILENPSVKPMLVITSPPYPGVHVLYHRWQVEGRRETPAPYYLAGLQDGHYESFFTMGSRTPTGLRYYFKGLRETFALLRQIIDSNALVVQLVGFSDPETQLPSYMGMMESAGYKPTGPGLGTSVLPDVRMVPNRRWYTQPTMPAAFEFLICHRPATSPSSPGV